MVADDGGPHAGAQREERVAPVQHGVGRQRAQFRREGACGVAQLPEVACRVVVLAGGAPGAEERGGHQREDERREGEGNEQLDEGGAGAPRGHGQAT